MATQVAKQIFINIDTLVSLEEIVQLILKPFHSMTGIECVGSHAEPDEEEEVSDYEVFLFCSYS